MKTDMNESRGLIYQTRNNENGIALILVLGILAVLAVLATTFAFNARLEQKAARNYLDAVTADCIARAGVEYAIALLNNDVTDSSDCEGRDWNRDDWGYLDTSPTGEGIFAAYDDSGTYVDVNVDGWDDTSSSGDDDGVDTRWKGVWNNDDILVGRYAVLVIDESSKMNINCAGNIASSGSHGDNEGWTTAEIDLAQLPNISSTDAENIVKYRYGLNEQPGDDIPADDDEANKGILEYDGIDNDGDGSPPDEPGEGDNEPDEFTPWCRRDDDNPFSTISQIKLVTGIGSTIWDNVKNLVTAHSRTRNQYWDSVSWKPKININAVAIAKDLYDNLDYDGIGIADLHQKVCNIMDYRDDNFVLSTLYNTAASTWIYGVEPILINEVLGKSYKDDTSYTGTLDGTSHTKPYAGLAPNTYYRVTINTSTYDAGEFEVTIGTVTEPVNSNSYNFTALDQCIPVAGQLSIKFEDTSPPPGVGDGTVSTVTSVEFTCAEFVELCNASDENINLTSWTIDVGSGDVTIPDGESSGGNTNWISARSYYVLTNDEELFDYSYGAVKNGSWGDAGESIPVVDMSTAVSAPDDWATGYATTGEFAETCNVDIVLKNEYGFCADLASNNETGRYGNSPRIGVSMEKIDPTVRDSSGNNWDENNKAASPNEESSPGADNDRFGVHTLSEIEIKNHPFASVGEMSDTSKYKGVRSGAAWTEISGDDTSDDLGKIAERITVDAVRLDPETTTDTGSWIHTGNGSQEPYLTESYRSPSGQTRTGDWEWTSARLQPIPHVLYIYGLYINDDDYFSAINVRDYKNSAWDSMSAVPLEYQPSDGLDVGTITTDNISPNGSFRIRLTSSAPSADVYFDYLLLVPQSTLGKINVNTAWVDVLAGLPGINVARAQAIYDSVHTGSPETPFLKLGDVLRVSTITAAEFAPISNLISVHSDVFKIICLAQTIQDLSTSHAVDDPAHDDMVLAEKKVEVIVDRSSLDSTSGSIRILSWKEITE